MINPDAALVEQAKRGDQQAFAALYQRHQKPVYSLIRHLTGDDEVAADLTQDTFVKAWHGLPRLRATHAFAGWLRIIATNLVRDKSRRRRPESTITENTTEDGPEFEIADDGPHLHDQYATRLQQQRIREAVVRLPEPQRAVIVMHHLEDVPVAEIAVQLAIPLGTVLSRLARGREALRRRLGLYVAQERENDEM
ncbi:MAG: sigma-70 family RNA polymerase sigma factor [Armatimonadota bacterium]